MKFILGILMWFFAALVLHAQGPRMTVAGTPTILEIEEAEVDVRDILDGFLKDSPPAGSSPAKLAALYSAWMDEAGIEARGPDPLKADLAKIDGLTDKTALLTQMAQVDYSAPFSIGLQADPDDPTKYATASMDLEKE